MKKNNDCDIIVLIYSNKKERKAMIPKGLNSREVEESRKKSGPNILTQLPPDPLWKKILRQFTDPMIIILLVALAIQVVLFILGQSEWFEPVGVLIAILIANGVSSISEAKQESKALNLKNEVESKEVCKVIRDGKLDEINISEVVAGDVVYLQSGDKIPADGIILQGEITVDQSSLNGETEEAEKNPYTKDIEYNVKDLLNPCYIYRGTVVCSGEAYLEVKVVGDKTLFGELALEVQEEKRKTPLQIKLTKLAKQISKFGYIGAISIIAVILLKTIFSGEMPQDIYEWVRLILNTVTVSVTVIVCAVPEGLPMLTSILLSFQSIRMAKDNVLVHKINGLETAGSINILFSDKTGTITEGKLSVTEFASGNGFTFKNFSEINNIYSDKIITATGVNNSASSSDGKVIGGNSTDRALMGFLLKSNYADRIKNEKIIHMNAFDSKKKYSSAKIKEDDNSEALYIKGAPEKIISRCSKYIDADGNIKDFSDKSIINEYINKQAALSMRLLAAAYSETGEEDSDLVFICVISIRDNVRKEAVEAINEVKNAGIQVVMVTGDRKETAMAIAKDAGLLKNPDDIAITSAELAEKTDDEVKEMLPHLRVVSRALPTDKSRLVRLAQELDYVVGMTGDGVNDSPALKKADVGFAMGSGTEVAKEAGDITILDDNFLSIEKAILYGRTMFINIRKFLIFQLTINVAAVLICFLGPLFGENTVLTVTQLLLINLAMDTLAAIAFGSEPANRRFMKNKPVPRSEEIVNKSMFVQILINAFYITVVCLGILFVPFIKNLFGDVDTTYLKSALFATFVMAITFNGFNARTGNLNVFEGLNKNKNFIIVMLSIFVMQFVFVTFGGKFLSVESLDVKSWIICIILALLVIPIDIIRKAILKKIRN